MRFGVAAGCFLPQILRMSTYRQLGQELRGWLADGTADFVSTMPLRPAQLAADNEFPLGEHYEGPWDEPVAGPNGSLMYEDPDWVHRLVFPVDPRPAVAWCERQRARGALETTNWLTADGVLAPNAALELHPGPGIISRRHSEMDGGYWSLVQERQFGLGGLGATLAEVNGHQGVFTFDTYHGNRGGWNLHQLSRLREIGPYVRDCHLQPSRDAHGVWDFRALLDGKETVMVNSIRFLHQELGFDGDVTLEVSPMHVLPKILGWGRFWFDRRAVLATLREAMWEMRDQLAA